MPVLNDRSYETKSAISGMWQAGPRGAAPPSALDQEYFLPSTERETAGIDDPHGALNRSSRGARRAGGGERPPDAVEVRRQLDRILAWEPFVRSERLSRFIRFIVEQALEQSDPVLKEYVIAVEVFDKPKSFDPRLDPIVRVEARRLRTRLREYYEVDGRNDPVVINVARRGYAPEFSWRKLVPAPAAPPPKAAVTPIRGAGLSVEPASAADRGARPVALAVLPFLDLSQNGDQQYFCAGFTEELINAVAREQGLRVASRTSSSQYEGRAVDIRQVGRELGVGYVLEGSVRTSGRRVRIAAQLSGVEDGFEMWSSTYDRECEDIFTIQEETAADIAGNLRMQLAAARPAPAPAAVQSEPAAGITSPRAYGLYLRGLQQWRKAESADAHKSIYHFERALEEDPNFGAAHAGLAHSYAFLAWFNEMRPAEAWAKAESSALTALELDPAQTAVHAVIACAQALFNWNWSAAEREFLRAMELNSSDPAPHMWYAVACLSPQKRTEEALREIKIAQKLEPLSPLIETQAALMRFYRGEYADAAALCRGALEIEPGFWPAQLCLGRALTEAGNLGEAEATLLRAQQASSHLPSVTGHLAYCYALQGKREKALSIAARLRRLARSRYVSPLHQARIHTAFGELDAAFEFLESARLHRCCRMVELLRDPLYNRLRDDSRFTRVVRCVGLPEGPMVIRNTA